MRRFVSYALPVFAITVLTLTLKATIPQVTSGTWASAGNLSTSRAAATATLLPDGRILFAGGRDADGNALNTAEVFNPDGLFTLVSPMNTARYGHAAVLIPDSGYVLVTGGNTTGGGVVNTAEIFDAVANKWTTVSQAMVEARTGHTMSLLPNHQVLIAGGENSSGPLAALETFDLATISFRQAGVMAMGRKGHAAGALEDGRVLISGGATTGPDGYPVILSSTEIFDPATGAVSPGPTMSTPRTQHTATTLLDGRIALIGGTNGSVDLGSADIYDPTTNTITAVSSTLSTPRSGHQAFLLPNNNNVLIVAGGSAGQDLASVELYTPWTGSFATTGAMSIARSGASGAGMSGPATSSGIDGLLLVTGGSSQQGAELYGFATVKTDKPDYAPGQVVTITGTGWQPNEAVTLTFRESPSIDAPGPFTVQADGFGNILDAEFAPDAQDLHIRFYVTAVGANSGFQAQNTFTDAVSINKVVLNGTQSPSAVVPGNTAQYGADAQHSVEIDFNGSGAACTATLSAAGLPAGATASFSGNPFSSNNGSTQFSLLTINTGTSTPAGTYAFTILATASGGCSNNRQTTGTLVVVGPATKLLFGTQPVNTQAGAVMSPSVVVNVTDANGVIRPDGAAVVTVTLGTNPSGATLSGPLTVAAANGVATFIGLSLDKVGTGYTLLATSSPLAGATSSSFNVLAADTTTQLASSSNPSNFGQSVTFTGTVTNSNSLAAVTEGCVTLIDNSSGGATLGGPSAVNGSGQASFTLSSLAVGGHNLQANYNDSGAGCANPGTNFSNSHSLLTQNVSKDNTSTAVSSSKNPSNFGDSVTFTAVVNNTSANTTATPTGTVQFMDGATNLDSPVTLVAGSASLATSTLSIGTHTITAVYTNSDGNFNGSTGTLNPDQVVRNPDTTPPSTTVTLGPTVPNGNNGWYKTNVHVTVSASDNAGGSGVAETRCALDPAAAPASFDDIPSGCAYLGTGADVAADGQHALYAASKDHAGNKETPVGRAFNIDQTAPTNVTGAPNRTADHNGWYNHAVDIVFSGQDSVSGIDSCTTTTYSSPDGTALTVTGTCTDRAGNTSAAVASAAFNYDATAPTNVTGAPNRAPDHNGWYNHSVDLVFSGQDTVSGIYACTTTTYSGPDGTAVTVNGTCTDKAGNTSAEVASSTFQYDATTPTATLSVTAGTPGANGWYISDVTVHTSGAFSVSGGSCTTDQAQTAETKGTAFNGSCTSGAGLTGNATLLTVKLDKTGPSATLAVTAGTPGNNGWYTSSVTVGTTGNDDISGPVTCTNPQVFSTDTADQAVNGFCTNDAGLTTNATALHLKIDKTPPTLNPSVSPNPVLLNGTATANANATDATSGVATSSCGTVVSSAVGTFSVSCSATDNAGNTASAVANYTVRYNVCVLYDYTKSHKVGSTIPIKLQLCDANRADYSSAGVIVHATSVVRIDSNASAVLDDSGEANAPDYDFRFDPTLGVTGGYIFNLSTKTSGYSTGTYKLTFSVNGISQPIYLAQFDIR